MSIMRVRFSITGLEGLPGVHTTYWNGASSTPVGADASDVTGRVRAFWDSFKANLAVGTVLSAPLAVDILNPASGALEGQLAPAALSSVVGTGTGSLPSATMLLLKLGTAVVVGGRRLQGRSFIGPLATTANSGGNPTGAVNTALLTAGGFLFTGATASVPVVWHRPKGSPPAGGSASPVTVLGTAGEFAVLRSRRD